VAQESVDFVRDYQFRVRDMLLVQPPGEIDRLLEWHIAVVVALDQQHG